MCSRRELEIIRNEPKNPRSTIKMAVDRVTPESPPHFKRFYVFFEALKRGWKEGCRPILDLDGCFLKGLFKGELLAVVGKDGDNQIYLVAWAIVEGECIDSWAWFLSLLTADLRMEDGFGYTIISDQQKREWKQIKEDLYKLDEGVAKELFSKNSKAWTKAF
ncbi:hypothetical protein Gotri_026473 [Gossypium trilobum]|uniref:MULE transposase domain-containing protein n=1 Tax=Gossypium trilobum TaxID=34281 RepID=A0A7J9FV78_9ROSI|nr:hypothetical protein [Gossypium trilobum]